MPAPDIVNEPLDEHLIRYGMPFVPRMIARARGTLLWDTSGREVLDFTSGQMCATLGHNHPRILEAIAEACQGVLHLFSGMLSPPVVELSRRLTALLPPSLSKAMFLSTGAEANEAAIKMAKLHTGNFEIVGLTGAWHGMTSGAQSVNYVAGRKGYGPMMPGSLALCRPIIRSGIVAKPATAPAWGQVRLSMHNQPVRLLRSLPNRWSSGGIIAAGGYWQKVKQHCEGAACCSLVRLRPPLAGLARISLFNISASNLIC
jgi:2,2-dialkylglycine decarboxylase (pyruvate)